VPLLIRGGSIIPTRERTRRSSTLMKNDPFTLRIALDTQSNARGELYLDDGVTFSHREGALIWREFVAEKSKGKGLRISNRDLAHARPADAVQDNALSVFDARNPFAKSIEGVRVEKIVVLGLAKTPIGVDLSGGVMLQWEYTAGIAAASNTPGVASALTIKNPQVGLTDDWSIYITV
jgi:mannosyl-oligosaccharide alpha-1,3-glucosidase